MTVNYNQIAQMVKKEVLALQNRAEQLRQAYSALLTLHNGTRTHRQGTGRTLSADARDRIAAAQRKRWAKYHKTHKKAA